MGNVGALADAVAADAKAQVMRGHRTVGTGRIHLSVEATTLELRLAHWENKNTATLAEAEVVELIDRLTTALPRLRAAKALAAETHEDLA